MHWQCSVRRLIDYNQVIAGHPTPKKNPAQFINDPHGIANIIRGDPKKQSPALEEDKGHMHVTGPYLEGPGSFTPQMTELKTPEDAVATVNFWIDRGVDNFKAYNFISRAVLKAAIDAAHKNPTVLAMWEKFFAICDCVPLNTLAEAQDMFAGFEPMEG